jgi:tripeptidyl-peptidase-1
MVLSLLVLVISYAGYVAGAPAPLSYTVHEKQEVLHQKWVRLDGHIHKDSTIPLSIGLAQQNLDNAYDFLMDVSHPESPNYGSTGPWMRSVRHIVPIDVG